MGIVLKLSSFSAILSNFELFSCCVDPIAGPLVIKKQAEGLKRPVRGSLSCRLCSNAVAVMQHTFGMQSPRDPSPHAMKDRLPSYRDLGWPHFLARIMRNRNLNTGRTNADSSHQQAAGSKHQICLSV